MQQLSEDEIGALERARESFEAGFARSRRGNLWRHHDGQTLTVFQREGGSFAWCISTPDGPRFSPRSYDDLEWALAALWENLNPDWQA